MRAIVVATLNDGTRHLVSIQAENTASFMSMLKGPLICLPLCNSFYADKGSGVRITPDNFHDSITVSVKNVPDDICLDCKKLFNPEKHGALVVVTCRIIEP